MEQKSVLITGGSGLIGSYLSSLLLSKGYRVSFLSRKNRPDSRIPVFRWDPENNYIDPEALDTDFIVHLAGANIGEGRWTPGRKKEIVQSRVASSELIFNKTKEYNSRLSAFISASATGFYGSSTSDNIHIEQDPPADDFLGTTCRLWEEAANRFSAAGIRTVTVRTAVVFEKTDGAMRRFLSSASFGVFPILGSGNQWMPWIHIDDLCHIYLKAIEDTTMKGPYNAVAPSFVNNRDFMKILSSVMKKPFFHPPVPAFLLRLAMGESSVIALSGSRVASLRLTESGFIFRYPDTAEALRDIINR